jgi:hypothetical protein
MLLFNNREIATAIWLIIIIASLVARSATRSSFVCFIKSACASKLLLAYSVGATTMVCIVFSLWNIGFWSISELKDTIVWFFVSGIWLLFRGISSSNPEKAVLEAVKDAFRIFVIVEFLVNAFTFSLAVECILLPVLVIIQMLKLLAKGDHKSALAFSILQIIQSTFGFLILGFTSWSLIHKIHCLWSVETLKDFMLPLVLTVAYLPAVYAITLFSFYEQLYLPLKLGRDKPNSVVRYAKIKLFLALGLGISRIHNATHLIGMELRQVISRRDVDRAMLKLEKQMTRMSSRRH